MIIVTNKGERIVTGCNPYRIPNSPLYYATGSRWIKTRQVWSGSVLIHSFKSFTIEAGQYNLALHEHMLALGYEHAHHDEDYEDIGCAESGPKLTGGPAYDQYTGPDEYVFATADGVLDRQARDLDFERWADDQVAANA